MIKDTALIELQFDLTHGVAADISVRRNDIQQGTLVQITLHNGYIVSVGQGGGYYSTIQNDTFEVAILKDGKFIRLTDWDDVMGHVPRADVIKLIEKYAAK